MCQIIAFYDLDEIYNGECRDDKLEIELRYNGRLAEFEYWFKGYHLKEINKFTLLKIEE